MVPGAFGGCETRVRLSRALLAARTLPSILYKRLYIPIYIFTRTHTYLTFFPFHVVYSPYVRLAGSVGAMRVCVLRNRTKRTSVPIYVFLERVKLLYLSFLLFRSVVERNTLNADPRNILLRFMDFIFVIYTFRLECFINFYF